jgi:purine-binding chemotaxis protein CheW
VIQVAQKSSALDINAQFLQIREVKEQEGERFLRFSLNPETDGLTPLGDLQEVINISLKNILPVPQLTESILGIINWRGKATWIVDLPNLCGDRHWCRRSPIAETGMAMLVQWQGETIGLLIQEIKTIEVYDLEQCLPIPEEMFSQELSSLALGYSLDSGGKTRIVLNISSIMEAINC